MITSSRTVKLKTNLVSLSTNESIAPAFMTRESVQICRQRDYATPPNSSISHYSVHCHLSPFFIIILASSALRFDARSPLMQCFTIQGCRSMSSNGILFSGSSTSSCCLSINGTEFAQRALTLFIKSFASALTYPGTVISHLAIRLWVMTGVSSNGASPHRNSYVKTPKLHRSTFSL